MMAQKRPNHERHLQFKLDINIQISGAFMTSPFANSMFFNLVYSKATSQNNAVAIMGGISGSSFDLSLPFE